MIITSSTRVFGSGSNPRKANIEKQIRRLEAKMAKLLEKLTNKEDSSSQNVSADLAQASVVLHRQATGSQGAGGDASSGNADSATNAASSSAAGGQDTGQILRNLGTSFSSGGGQEASFELEEDPEEILKQIQLIQMQIAMLRQQLGDDAMTVLSGMDEGNEDAETVFGEAAAKLQAAVAAAELPSAEVANGHVDGYA